MAEYHNITQEEIEGFLIPQGFSALSLPGTVELVYGKRVDQDDLPLTLRVYTGINPSGDSRDVGKDAIRVNLFYGFHDRDGNRKIIKMGGSKRVHRVKGWAKNLQSRLNGWLDFLPKHKCDKCGKPMIPRSARKDKKRKFLGCAGYPDCDNTRPVK